MPYNPPKINKDLQRAAQRRAYEKKKAERAALKEQQRRNRERIAQAINQYEASLAQQN